VRRRAARGWESISGGGRIGSGSGSGDGGVGAGGGGAVGWAIRRRAARQQCGPDEEGVLGAVVLDKLCLWPFLGAASGFAGCLGPALWLGGREARGVGRKGVL
jgi:hypothetical protein